MCICLLLTSHSLNADVGQLAIEVYDCNVQSATVRTPRITWLVALACERAPSRNNAVTRDQSSTYVAKNSVSHENQPVLLQ
jgi:hypothetical protein